MYGVSMIFILLHGTLGKNNVLNELDRKTSCVVNVTILLEGFYSHVCIHRPWLNELGYGIHMTELHMVIIGPF